MEIDIINLNSGQSLIFGNTLQRVGLKAISEKQSLCNRLDVKRFGFFESASPNFVTYYPDIRREDLTPEETQGDFILPVFRGLSEVIIHKKYNPIDFSMGNVLRKSMPLLSGQSVYPNHEMLVGNELGVILDTEWQKEYKTEDSITVPAGINVRLKIDGKAHPTIARGINMEPPSIHSSSVTVEFAWEQSDPLLSSDEFWAKLGTYDKNGDLIRRVVTEIRRYHEISLVPHGADPFAQKINDASGTITNPVYADRTYSLSDGSGSKKAQVYVFSYKEDMVSLSETEPNNPIKINNENMKQQLLAFLALTQLTIEGSDKMEDKALSEAIGNAMKASTNKVVELSNSIIEKDKKLGELETEKTNLTAEVNSLKSNAEIGKVALEATRTEVEKVYKLIAGDKIEPTMLAVIKEADFATLTALGKNYNTQLNEKFPGVCNDCQSNNVSRQSVLQPGSGVANHQTTPAGDTSKKDKVILTNDEVMANLKAGRFKKDSVVSSLHQEVEVEEPKK